MSQAPSMPMFWGDYLADTGHLSTEEHGAYLLLLAAMWMSTEPELPDDDRKLARIARSDIRKWRQKLRPAVEDFFEIRDGNWHQKRLERERVYVKNLSEVRTEVGKRGARARWLKNNETDMANGMAKPMAKAKQTHWQEQWQNDATHTQKKDYLSVPHRTERDNLSTTAPAREEPACAMIAPARRRATASSRKTPADEAREAIAQGLDPLTGKPAADLDEEIPA